MLHTTLANHATLTPDKPALVYGDHTLTYADLHAAVTTFADTLPTHGLSPGDHVALWLPNSPAFAVAFYATLAAGAVAAPLNPASKRGDLTVPQGGYRLFLTTPDLQKSLHTATTDHPGAAGTPVIQLDPTTPVLEPPHNLISPTPDSRPPTPDRSPPTPDSRHPTPDSPALLAFSSGSTGKPKSLVRTHAQLHAEAVHYQNTLGITADDTVLCTIPLFHAHGLGNALMAAVHAGATLVVMPRPAPFPLVRAAALTLLQDHAVTVFPTVPMQVDALAELPGTDPLPALRHCFTAGSPLKPDTAQAFHRRFAAHVRQLYGCTEAGSVTIDLDNPPTPSAVGTPMAGIELEVVDADRSSCPPGTPGEVRFRSAACTAGYTDAAPGANDAFADGWFHTGDNGYLDSDGRLHITGRKHFVVEIAGHKVYLPEVEEILATAPGVRDIALTTDTTTGTLALKAHIVPTPDFSEQAFTDFTKQSLPHHKRPHTLTTLNALPKTPLGKLARDQLI